MPSTTTFRIPILIDRVENKHELVEQHKTADGGLTTISRDLGWFAIFDSIAIKISDHDPGIRPGTRAFLQIVVPTEE